MTVSSQGHEDREDHDHDRRGADVMVPAVIEMPRATASFELMPVVPGLLDPGQDEDVVVHREPEQDREDEDGHERLDRAAA